MRYTRNILSLGSAAAAIVALWSVHLALAQPTPSCVGFNGSAGSQCQLTATATDPENDQIYYVFSWGDGTADTRMPGAGFVASGTPQTATHTWNSTGSFTIRVYAYDEANHQSVASDPVLVNITPGTEPTVAFVPNGRTWASSTISTTITASDSEGITYTRHCWIENGSGSSCDPGTTASSTFTNGTAVTQAADGQWRVCVKARDTVGTWNSSPICSAIFQKDGQAPTAPGQPSCSSPTAGLPVCTWSASTDSGGSLLSGYDVYISLNGGAFSQANPAFTSAATWIPSSTLAHGTYRLRVYARDGAGNMTVSANSSDFIVDRVAPAAGSCSPGTGTYYGSVAVSCTAGADQTPVPTTATTLRYTEQAGGTPADPDCSSPVWSNKSYGATTVTTLKVRTCDAVGNSSAVTSYTYTVQPSVSLAATLTSTSHSAAVWTNDAGFDYTTFCQAASGFTLSYCRTQRSENNGTWSNVPGGDPSTTGQATTTYSGTYTMATAGSGYRFRSRTDDTDPGSSAVNSTLIPVSGQIQFDNQIPVALASSPLANQSGPFSVSVTLQDYPNPGTGPNSGVTAWDMQYSTNGGTNWNNCKLNVSYLTTSFTFGSGCDTPVALQPDTTYCFQARARDGVTHPGSPNQSSYVFDSGTMCTPYQVGSPPIAPNTPTPTTGSVAAASTSLTWKGGDPDVSDVLTYRVYISQPNQALSVPADLDGTITNQLPDPNAIVNYGPPQNRTLTAGQVYQWQVVAVDSTSKTTNGPVWTFTVNTLPTIISVDITPNPVDRIGTITWSVSDPNAAQSLSFGLYYGPVQGSTAGATSIASGLSPAAYCTGAPNNWSCTFDWDASCVVEAANQYVVLTVNDGAQTTTGGDTSTFAIQHTRTLYYPGPNDTTYATSDGSVPVVFPIESGSIETGSSYIRFRGACSATDNPTADANAPGNPASYGGSLAPGVNSPDITLNDLLPGVNNTVSFSVGGCGTTQYRIRYNLVTSCGEPFLGVEQGSIYSGGNIRAIYAPPEGSFNATYLILGGGTAAQPRIIENFIAEPGPPGLTTVNPTFGQILYPQASESQLPQVGAFDYYGLTHQLSGSEVQDNQTNSYGHTVQVTNGDATLEQALGGASTELGGQVYYVKGDLTVDQPAQFLNAASGSGAGLIVVDGDLTIQSDVSYQAAPISGSIIRTLASVGWLVRGNVTVAGGVGQLVGAFYVSGTSSGGGVFDSGSSPTQLNIFGAVIAKQLILNRTYGAAGQPSERVVADGRILLNTPPGFANILQSLPAWQFRTP